MTRRPSLATQSPWLDQIWLTVSTKLLIEIDTPGTLVEAIPNTQLPHRKDCYGCMMSGENKRHGRHVCTHVYCINKICALITITKAQEGIEANPRLLMLDDEGIWSRTFPGLISADKYHMVKVEYLPPIREIIRRLIMSEFNDYELYEYGETVIEALDNVVFESDIDDNFQFAVAKAVQRIAAELPPLPLFNFRREMKRIFGTKLNDLTQLYHQLLPQENPLLLVPKILKNANGKVPRRSLRFKEISAILVFKPVTGFNSTVEKHLIFRSNPSAFIQSNSMTLVDDALQWYVLLTDEQPNEYNFGSKIVKIPKRRTDDAFVSTTFDTINIIGTAPRKEERLIHNVKAAVEVMAIYLEHATSNIRISPTPGTPVFDIPKIQRIPASLWTPAYVEGRVKNATEGLPYNLGQDIDRRQLYTAYGEMIRELADVLRRQPNDELQHRAARIKCKVAAMYNGLMRQAGIDFKGLKCSYLTVPNPRIINGHEPNATYTPYRVPTSQLVSSGCSRRPYSTELWSREKRPSAARTATWLSSLALMSFKVEHYTERQIWNLPKLTRLLSPSLFG
ncbi:hypothetical protein HDE_01477 [Halotydeus destructor]|nr:hypothetical protein HDE_01477 [Halotydeus destructor]